MSVNKTTGTYKSTCEAFDIEIFYAVWQDDSKKPIGIVQLTHGWAEYIERYDEMARYLAEAGYIVCGQDHLGHGKTTGLACLGTYPPKAGKWMIEDMHTLREFMQEDYPDLPYMLYGHSLGSLMVRAYISKYGEGLTSCVICGTVPIPQWGIILEPICYGAAKIICNFEKEFSLKEAKFNLNPISEEIGNKNMDLIGKLTTSWLSYDYDNRKTYFNNPYTTLIMSTTILDMFPATLNAGKFGWARRVPKELPIFIVSGKADLAGLYTLGPKEAFNKLQRSGHDVRMKLYHGKHEIHNEGKIKTEVLRDQLNFYNAHNPLLNK